MKKRLLLAIPLIVLPGFSYPQERVAPADLRPVPVPSVNQTPQAGISAAKPNRASGSDPLAGSSTVGADYTLGPGDLLTLSEVDLEDTAAFTDKTFRIDNSGDVTFPLAGRVHAAGLTMAAVQSEVNQRLGKILKDPDAVVGVAEFHSQPVSVLGAVNNPGIMQISAGKNLFEVLSLAGGLRPDAGNSIMITRSAQSGAIPLPDAKPDSTGQFSVASVRVKNIMSATDPAQNITVMPEDIITVPKGEVVYAVGALTMPGGFLLGENATLSTLQVISLAQGLVRTSSPAKAQILRAVPGSPGRLQIAVNVKSLLAGKAPDVPLQPDDILFIPDSAAKIAAGKVVSAALSAATGIAVYGRY